MPKEHKELRWLTRLHPRLPIFYMQVRFGAYNNLLLMAVVVLGECLALLAIGRRILRPDAVPDVATAVYYALSTIAQTTAALAGFVLAFVALRLPMVVRTIADRRSDIPPTADKPAGHLVKALLEARLKLYEVERESMIRRTIVALGASGVTVGACFLGLALVPWLDQARRSQLLFSVVVLAVLALDAQMWLLLPSLRTMRYEVKAKAEVAAAKESPPS